MSDFQDAENHVANVVNVVDVTKKIKDDIAEHQRLLKLAERSDYEAAFIDDEGELAFIGVISKPVAKGLIAAHLRKMIAELEKEFVKASKRIQLDLKLEE